MALDDISWSARVIDIVARMQDGFISEEDAAQELADATQQWPTRTLSNADLSARVVSFLAQMSGMIITNGVPPASAGANGSMALDSTNGRLYGPKTAGAWGAGIPLAGAPGPMNPATSYPLSAATVVPKGVTAVNLTNGGTGKTNGTGFVGTFTGGAGTGAQFLFDVVGGVVGNIRNIQPGYGYTSNPTPVFTASAGGTGLVATATADVLVKSGEFYWAATATGTERLYQNVAGVATAQNLYRPYAGKVIATAAASNNVLWTVTPETGFGIQGTGQVIRAIAPGFNGLGINLVTPGLFGGVATPLVLPSLEPVPLNHLKTNYPFEYTPVTIAAVNYLILMNPPFIPVSQIIQTEWMGRLAFTLGGPTAIAAGNTITGATSGVTAVVTSVPPSLMTGTWVGNNAAGTIFVKKPAEFIAGEDILVGGVYRAKAGGPVSTTPSLDARIKDGGQNYPTAAANVDLELVVEHDKIYGGSSLRLWANDGITNIFPASTIYDSTDTVQQVEANLYAKGDTLKLSRQASGRVLLRKFPDITSVNLSESAASEMDGPFAQATCFLHRKSRKRWDIKSKGIAYDNAADKMNSDVQRTLMIDLTDMMSQDVNLKNEHAWLCYAEEAEVKGRKHRYSALSSDELNGGIFDQLQPSINECVGIFGPYGTAFSDVIGSGPYAGKLTWQAVGLGHGMLRLVPGTATVRMESRANGNGAWTWYDITNTPIGSRKRGRQLEFTATYDAFRYTTTGVECIGRVTFTHSWSYAWVGIRLFCEYKFGRSLPYTNYGSTVIAEGATITGATSGTTATVVVIPANEITSGTVVAGTAAGRMNVTNVVGAGFTAGENLTVGGITRAKFAAGGVIGSQIGVQQNYGFNLVTTDVNEAKVAGLPAQDTGFERAADASIGLGMYTQPHGQGSRFQTRHKSLPDVIYECLNMDATWTEASSPMTGGYPAGQGVLSGWWMQDREEGVRKGYQSVYTGAAQNVFEGVKTARAVRRFRQGTFV